MKNLNTIILGVLVVAVGVLYYLHFSSQSFADKLSEAQSSGEFTPEGIAFINTDSLFENYDKYQDMSEDYENKAKNLEAEFQNRAQGLQREVANYQQTRNNLTIGQARAVEEDLMNKEQNLRQYQQSLQQQLLQDENKMINELFNGVTEYLNEYGKKHNLQVVLTYSTSNRNILFASDSLDITKSIVKGLNNKYNKGQVKAPASADTTSVSGE